MDRKRERISLASKLRLGLLLLCIITAIVVVERTFQLTTRATYVSDSFIRDAYKSGMTQREKEERQALKWTAVTTRYDTLCPLPPILPWKTGVITKIGITFNHYCHKLKHTVLPENDRLILKSLVNTWRLDRAWEAYANSLENGSCEDVKKEFINNFYVSEAEKQFPIAYILVVHTNPGQILRMLKAIYRPHNLYCISPDVKQGEQFRSYFDSIAECLDNVFVVSKPVHVYYGHISVLDAQLNCMRDLDNYHRDRWKYTINLCGREVPVKTNREIVESLKKQKGYTVLNLRKMSDKLWKWRFRYKYRIINGELTETREPQDKPPLKIYKSLTYLASSREFISFILHDPVSLTLYNYLKTVHSAEEHFYSTLYVLPQAPGAQPPNGLIKSNDVPFVIKAIWALKQKDRETRKRVCPGSRVIHYVCILSAAELIFIQKSGVDSHKPVFFFNKYFLDWDPTPMDCMEERLVQTNMDEYTRDCDNKDEHLLAKSVT